MSHPEERLIKALQQAGVGPVATVPCDRIKGVLGLLDAEGMQHIPVTREEEGVGICAGAALAGRRPAMVFQNSGLGNMVNALMSLTGYYSLPLAMFISHRGVYKEAIAAQEPMGRTTPGLLDAMGIAYTVIEHPDDFDALPDALEEIYTQGRMHAFLLNPKVWEGSGVKPRSQPMRPCMAPALSPEHILDEPNFTRYDLIKSLTTELKGRIVVANLGIPAKELYSLLDQPSNFYMMGSMGMATPIALGIAMNTAKRVIVIDGDGSLLMNTGVLATVARVRPANLSILCIDNAAYGSTGNQPTATGYCVNISQVAHGMGLKNTVKTARVEQVKNALSSPGGTGPLFVHALAVAGNAAVGNIPLSATEIRDRFMTELAHSVNT